MTIFEVIKDGEFRAEAAEFERQAEALATYHGKGIDDYYRSKREAGNREREVLRKMREAGASSSELQKQEQIAIDAGDCGD